MTISAGPGLLAALLLAAPPPPRGAEAPDAVEAGLAHWQRAEYPEATALCQEALRDREASADPAGQADALTCLGRILFKQGEHEAAVARYREALARREQAGDLRGQAVSHEDLAAAFGEQRDYASATAHYERAIDLARRAGRGADQSRMLGGLGYFYLRQGAESPARRCFRQALEVAVAARDEEGRASALSKLGGLESRRGRYRRALTLYGAALRIRLAIGDRREEAWTRTRIGLVHERQGRPDLALRQRLSAVAIWEAIRERRAAAWGLFEIGRGYEAGGDEARAAGSYQRALELAEQIHLPYQSLTLGRLARLHARRGDREMALDYGQRAVAEAERTGNPEMRWNAFYDLARAQLDLGLAEPALRSLRQSMAAVEEMRTRVAPTEEARAGWLEERRRVYADLIALHVERGEAGPALVVAERARARALLDLHGCRQAGAAPAAVATADEDALREQARGGDTLVEYFVAPERVFAWVVTPDGAVHSAVSPVRQEELGRLVEAAHVQGAAPAALRRLHALLIAPVRGWLPRDPAARVTLVPDGALFRLSFAALPDEQGRYLVESHTLAYSPSLSLLRYPGAPRPGAAEGSVLVVGNPAMPTVAGSRLPPLPSAEREARAISALFPRERVTTLVGPAAGEARVRALAPQQAILHLATHGLVHDEAPLDGLLALAPSQRAEPGGDDGRFTVAEILELELRADLVTLSACNTGRGRVTGEGVLGLGYAFLHAGASSLVVSLWRVADPVAELQMTRLYAELLRNGGDKPAALRSAQLATLSRLREGRLRDRSGRALPADPVYWAPFVLMGAPPAMAR